MLNLMVGDAVQVVHVVGQRVHVGQDGAAERAQRRLALRH
jgi:hypothetical protein